MVRFVTTTELAMRPHPTHPPKANGVRVLPHLDAGWVLVLIGLAVVTVAQRVFGL